MKITKVAYSKTYPIGMHWERIFIEGELSSDEDPRKALYECKKTVENFHYESNKADEKKKQEEKQSVSTLESIINDINSCADLVKLKEYRIFVKQKPELQAAYDKKLKELQ